MKSKKLSEKILRSIKSKGFNNITLGPVLETKYILQRSGENFKKFLFSFYDLNGKELCLRPDLTISSVIRFIQNKKDIREKVFYSGEAFRKTYQKKDTIIKNQIGYEILDYLRENGINSELYLDSSKNLKKQLTYADKKDCPAAIIVGESEIKENKFTLKNLKSSKENDQKTVSKESLINEIKKIIWKNS